MSVSDQVYPYQPKRVGQEMRAALGPTRIDQLECRLRSAEAALELLLGMAPANGKMLEFQQVRLDREGEADIRITVTDGQVTVSSGIAENDAEHRVVLIAYLRDEVCHNDL